RYTEVGKYSEVLGRGTDSAGRPAGPVPVFAADEAFRVTLVPGARWATAADFGTGDLADLRRAVRRRFGAALVLLDYAGYGRPDLSLPGAVTEGGRVRDLLLHNEGGGRFGDVTAAAGLAGDRPSLGASAADFDNDGRPDLIVTTAGGPKLFRNS